jgi:hypothetical protein
MRVRNALPSLTAGLLVLSFGGPAASQKPAENRYAFTEKNLDRLRNHLKDTKFDDKDLEDVFKANGKDKDVVAILLTVTSDGKTITTIKVSAVNRGAPEVRLIKTLDRPDDKNFKIIMDALNAPGVKKP